MHPSILRWGRAESTRRCMPQMFATVLTNRTGSHLLRHSVARRLLRSGSSLKEVADILRHRSIDTTAIYTKIDRRSLDAVALPWLGRTS
ncbi:tyrosine-type recombinase/integrase [Burkholderia sp. SRS-W-2-2016]|uniref:tyrosine-type recombinase/integrase n=1 Tax=Burkholderia sp. SRS-W-2-2016 TaxID=1926878 RepID=UPI00273D7A25|nr:tyrosine-type recombinase/integrase [Burkholderia sp. SRS-W-2-2016]